MKSTIARLVAVLFSSMLCFSVQGQSPQRIPPAGDFPDHIGGFNKESDLAGRDRMRATRTATRTPAYREDRIIKDGPLAPAVEDVTALANFLQAPGTGLIRLLPREDSFGKTPKVNIRGAGAYYSFARLTHEYNYGSDIELQQGNLSVGFAGADYGLMRHLGDVALDEVSIADPRALFMATYNPPSSEQEARAEGVRFRKGATVEGVLYRAMLPVEVSSTYLLRSIVYGSTDVLIAFRVIRKDSDGSVTIAWKRLQKYPPTDLIRSVN